MKKILLLPIYCVFACTVLPFITTLFIPRQDPPPTAQADTITVFSPSLNTTDEITVNDYLIGVVAAEMPASFMPEALKAQAVAARTYAMYKSSQTDHEADVCTDFNHCQAYITTDEMQSNWGNDFALFYNKIRSAVEETRGEYLTYNNEPIMAVFHSMGGGATENSSEVWGTQLPYLTSVPSPGEEEAPNYTSVVTLSFEEFKAKILQNYPAASLSSFLDVSQPTLTESGHVKSMIIGGVSVTGSSIRSIFSLRSTKFDLSFSQDSVIFTVTGYGHGVGMSQYGANAMAKEGKTYKEILSHYYQGVVFSNE